MVTLRIIYPVITANIITIEVPDEQAEDLFNRTTEEQATFIFELNEKAELPYMTNRKMIEAAMDYNYTRIDQIDPTPPTHEQQHV